MITKYLLPNIFLLLLTTSTAWANSPDDLNRSLELSQQAEKTQNISIDNLPKLSEVEADNKDMAEVTSVSQLSDIKPTDWAFQSLQSLVERYGCIAGYPNGTFRGNRAMTRYEFAAGLNACLEQVRQLIDKSTADVARKDDLVALQKLQEEFAPELATLRGRVDNLEARTGIIEKQQFSTTTKLGGEAIFGLASAFGGDSPGGLCPDTPNFPPIPTAITPCNPRQRAGKNTTLSYLVRLGLQTSFTGKDSLRTYLTTGNSNPGGFANPASLDTNMARLSDQAGLNNQVRLDLLEYRLPVFNDRALISIIPSGFALSSILAPNSGYFDIGRGAISNFAQVNPIFKIGGGNTESSSGAGFDWAMTNKLRLQVAYGAGNSNNPAEGVTQSNRSVLGVNLLAKPIKNILAGITYVNAYTSDGRLGTFTGSVNADSSGRFSGGEVPVGIGNDLQPIGDLPAQTNAVGANLQWKITPQLTFGAWGGLTFTNYLKAVRDNNRPDGSISSGEKPFANTATYLLSLGLSDPFNRKGDQFAIMVGMPPKLTDAGPTIQGLNVPFSEISLPGEPGVAVTDGVGKLQNANVFGTADKATSMHYEVFYRFKASDYLDITPGFFVVTNPGHIEGNNTIFIGTIRTTFRF
jgi:hypothetical protein